MVASSIQLGDLRRAVSDAYEVASTLGQGGYGTVFRALHRRSGQAVALKVQRLRHDGDGRDPAYRIARFEREAKLCAALAHPNIVRLLDEGRIGDYLLLAFELVDGETLSAHLARRGALEPDEAAALMAQILNALAAAHSRGIVHRDLKPDNVMIIAGVSPAHAKILDFGAAAFAPEFAERGPALTLSREILGTPCYSAPEQLRGEPATARSDIYAWALIFLECLTGRRVMDGATIAQVCHKQLSASEVPLPAPLASHPLGALLRQALAKSPRQRPGDAAHLLAELRQSDLTGLHGQLALAGAGLKTLALDTAQFPAGEHRQVTAVSAGLRVAHAAAVDVETLDRAQKDRLRALAEVLQRFGGHVLGTLAGRTLAVFGLPAASESDPRRAALAALELVATMAPQRPPPAAEQALEVELRIGMDTGSVILDDVGAVSGPALDTACELEAQASPGSILVSAITRQVLRKHMRFERAEVASAGAGPPASYALVAESSGDVWRALGCGELVGRDTELELLLSHFQQARSGAGCVLLVRGDAGIGKSRVVAELCQRARGAGAALLDGHCLPEHSSSALMPLRALVQQRLDMLDGPLDAPGLQQELAAAGLDPELSLNALAAWLSLPFAAPAAPASPERQRELLLGTLTALLSTAGGEQGGILVLEDVHWCDPSTGELVARLSHAIARRPVMLVLTSRDTVDVEVHLDATLELSGLDADSARRVIAAQPGGERLASEIVDVIIGRTDGIPLFIEELTLNLVARAPEPALGSGTGPVPPGLRDLLHGKLDRLGAAKETAQLAAVIGRDFEPNLLSAISRREPAAVRADIQVLLEAGVARQLQAKPDRYLFRHELLREVAWDSMLSAQRSSAHRAAASELLERARRGVPAEPAELARHHELGGAYEEALEQYLIAGQAAARDGAYREALARFERAQACARRLGSEREGARRELDVLNAQGAVLIVHEGLGADRVLQTFTRAQELCAHAGASTTQRFAALKGLWTVRNANADYRDASRLASELLALAEASGDGQLLLTAHDATCQSAMLTADFPRALACAEACERWFDPAARADQMALFGLDPWLTVRSFEAMVAALIGRVGTARRQLCTLLELVPQFESPAHEAGLLAQAACIEFFIGSCGPDVSHGLERCRGHARAGLAVAEKHGIAFFGAYSTLLLAAADAHTSAARAAEALERALGLWALAGIRAGSSWWLCSLARARHTAGQFAAALDSAERALSHCQQTGEAYGLSESHRTLAIVLNDPASPAHDRGRAAREFRAALDVAGRQGAHWLQLRAAYSFAEHCEPAEAREVMQQALSWFDERAEADDTELVQACRRRYQT